MNVLVAGSREDVAGFGLAGVDGVVCLTPGEAEQVIARTDADTLVLVSGELGAAARRFAEDRLCVVLPVIALPVIAHPTIARS
jgi:hypothetical protein